MVWGPMRTTVNTEFQVCSLLSLEDNSHGSLALLNVLAAETLTGFVLDYLFKDICAANSLIGRDSASFWNKGLAEWPSITKDEGSLN